MSNFDENSAPESITLVTAINIKYGGLCDRKRIDPNNIVLPSPNLEPGGLIIKIKTSDHLPGKRRASGSLELLVLNDKNIASAGDLSELAILVKNITQLDLAKNCFSCWNEICQILNNMPLLEHCNLSHNPLYQSSFIGVPELNLNKLSSLVLNGTQISWPCLFKFLKQIPRLEELHLSLNDYNDVESHLPDTESFPNVHILHISRCRLSNWSAFAKICRLFPCLETVIAPENSIECLGDTEEIKEIFSCVHSLNLNKWPIKNWDDVDKCRQFPILSELRISHIPLLEPYGEDERRLLTIARLPDITLLNGSTVTPQNREDAERYFIRYYVEKDEKPSRYFELENVHGQLKKLLDVDLSPKEEAEVRLVFEDEDRVELRRVSLNQTVAQFKKSLQTFCGLVPTKMRLWYLDVEAPVGINCMEELRYPKLMLHSLRVADGDEFHIQDVGRCFRCGQKGHFGVKCSHKDAKCENCGKKGHLEKVCRSKDVKDLEAE